MQNYYQKSLAGIRLKKCYDIAPARVSQYLQQEIDYLKSKINPGLQVLELGAGYGRILKELAITNPNTFFAGIDHAESNITFSKEHLENIGNCIVEQMDVSKMDFGPRIFDVVFAAQNGIASFRLPLDFLIKEAIRITKPGGKILFSTYAPQFWHHRLHWFRMQAANGLIGPIDEKRTDEKTGLIVCKDGLELATVQPDRLKTVAEKLHLKWDWELVDDSFIVYTILL